MDVKMLLTHPSEQTEPGTNQDSRTKGITTPGEAQAKLIQQTYARAGSEV